MQTFVRLQIILKAASFGFILGKMSSVPHLTLDTKVNLLNALSTTATLAVALGIALIFDVQKAKNKTQKEILIKRVDQLLSTLGALQDDVVTGKTPPPVCHHIS